MMYVSGHSLILLVELSHLIYFEGTCESSVQVLIIFLVLYYWLLSGSVQRFHVCKDFSDINSLFHLISKII